MTIPKFSNVPHSFHTELKQRISNYFKEVGKSTTGNYSLFIKAILLVVSFLFVYIHLIFFTPAPLWAILECIVLGGLTASIGFNVMHDGAHGSFSKYKWVNNLAALSLNFLGANNFMWKTKHNVIHHSYTNIDGIDDDIDAKPFLRLCESQKRYKMHRYQHWYAIFFYSFASLSWVLKKDFDTFFRKKIGNFENKKHPIHEYFVLFGSKLAYFFVFLVLPIMVLMNMKVHLITLVIITIIAGVKQHRSA